MGDWEGKTAERTRGREKQGRFRGRMPEEEWIGRGRQRLDARKR